MSSSSSSLRSYGLPALTLAVLIPACLLMLASFPLTFPFTEHQAGQFTRTLSTSGPVALRVQTGSGSISVHAGNGSSVTIQATIYARHPHSDANLIHQVEQNPPIHQVGNQIQIGPLPREWQHRLSLSYVVSAPTSSSADLSSGSGDLQIGGLQGPVNATTGSGSVRASALGQLLHARTGSGDISANSIGGDAHLETGSGSISASGLAGGARASTGSGDIVVSDCQQALRASTGSGSIRVTQSSFRPPRLHRQRRRQCPGNPARSPHLGSRHRLRLHPHRTTRQHPCTGGPAHRFRLHPYRHSRSGNRKIEPAPYGRHHRRRQSLRQPVRPHRFRRHPDPLARSPGMLVAVRSRPRSPVGAPSAHKPSLGYGDAPLWDAAVPEFPLSRRPRPPGPPPLYFSLFHFSLAAPLPLFTATPQTRRLAPHTPRYTPPSTRMLCPVM